MFMNLASVDTPTIKFAGELEKQCWNFYTSMGARNRVVPARQATQPGGIGSLESILGLLESLKIQSQLGNVSDRCGTIIQTLMVITCRLETREETALISLVFKARPSKLIKLIMQFHSANVKQYYSYIDVLVWLRRIIRV